MLNKIFIDYVFIFFHLPILLSIDCSTDLELFNGEVSLEILKILSISLILSFCEDSKEPGCGKV